MIIEPVLYVILRCTACNTPFDDEEERPLLWRDIDEIGKIFAENADVAGWRRVSDLYLCPDCHVVDHDQVVEKAPGLSAVEQAVITRERIAYNAAFAAWKHLLTAPTMPPPHLPATR